MAKKIILSLASTCVLFSAASFAEVGAASGAVEKAKDALAEVPSLSSLPALPSLTPPPSNAATAPAAPASPTLPPPVSLPAPASAAATPPAPLTLPQDPALLPSKEGSTAVPPLPALAAPLPTGSAPAIPTDSAESKAAEKEPEKQTTEKSTTEKETEKTTEHAEKESPKLTAAQQKEEANGGMSLKHRHKKHAANTKPRYRNIHLPSTISMKHYDQRNQHLPIARYESDVDALVFVAIRRDDINGLRAALDYSKRDMNKANAQGDTPLIAAVKYNAVNSVHLLLGRHVNTHSTDAQGLTALQNAQRLGLNHMAKLLAEMDGFTQTFQTAAVHQHAPKRAAHVDLD